MDERTKYWSNPGKWPRDVPGQSRFLARAVDDVGRVLYPEEWSGTETLTPDPHGLPNFTLNGREFRLLQSSATINQKLTVHNLLHAHRPDFARPTVERGPFGPKIAPFTDEQWKVGLDLASRIDGDRYHARTRLTGAQNAIVDGCLSGQLVAVLRPLQGGLMSDPIPAHMWNSEKLDARFFWCQMNPEKPFGAGLGGDGYQYIFLTQQSLDAFLVSLRRPRASGFTKVDRTAKPNAPVQKLVDAFNSVIAEWRDGRRKQPTKVQWTGTTNSPGIAQSLVANAGFNQARDIWDGKYPGAKRPDEWSKRGPRGSR